ncbi:hypothetical protein ACFL52_00515 [Candidatus Margulisiibacteriota bacterium]
MSRLANVGLEKFGGSKLGQQQLKFIHKHQQSGAMTTVRQQSDLRRTFLENVAANHPAGIPVMLFNLKNPYEQTIILDSKKLEKYNIDQYFADFKRLAPKATAGLRETYDVLNWNNPNYLYNPVFLTLLIEAEARFIKEQHTVKSEMLKGIDLSAKAAEVEKELSPNTISTIREVFEGKSLVEILKLLRDKPMKVMGKEVRPQTDQMLELEVRLMAENGIAVITSEKFSDTTNIYLTSFLCFLLGSDGGTYYTPSHSSVYVLGRKVLSQEGAQLLPELYNRFIEILEEIIGVAKDKGLMVSLGARGGENIYNTLSYERTAKLFAKAMNHDPKTIDMINEAADKGLRITLNTLSGSAAKSLASQLVAFGVDKKVFQPLWEKEDSYFNAGYVAGFKDGEYFVDHLGVDTSAPKVVQQIPYAEKLKNAPIGRMVYECDPDNDRFLVKQVLAEDAIPLCEVYGIDYYKLGNGRILVAPSPNKIFLMLDIADYERMKASGEWEKYHFLYFPTYVSSAAWVEFANYLARKEGNISTFLCRVGFKNFNQALTQIQDWWFNRPEEPTLTIKPQLGDPITLNRDKPLRVLSKEEESGGRTAGQAAALTNILGERMLSLPEKAVGDALMAHLADMARRYLEKQELRLPSIIDTAYTKYQLISKIDYRLDILHGDQGIIAQVGPEKAAKLKSQAGAEKANFNNFFFSLGIAEQTAKLSLDKIRGILKAVLPEWSDTWNCLDSIQYVEEELTATQTRPEGVVMSFNAKDGKTPLVTKFKFRPSGTDPLKSKVYIDAVVLRMEQIREIEDRNNHLKRLDLYGVLDHYGIEYAEAKPAEAGQIELRPVALN